MQHLLSKCVEFLQNVVNCIKMYADDDDDGDHDDDADDDDDGAIFYSVLRDGAIFYSDPHLSTIFYSDPLFFIQSFYFLFSPL